MRVALGIEYDGSHFHGWQRQPDLRTVQGVVEKAVSHVAAVDTPVHCAGRTDTGVHASNQVIHFDTEAERSTRAWIYGVNTQLPKDVCVKWVKPVSDEFHARYSAISRRYRYVIYNNPIRPALIRSYLTWQYRQLNHKTMNKAAACLIGEHDFTSFRASQCQSKTPVRHITSLSVKRLGDLIVIDVTANAFLHHMVRNIAGTLIAVGSDRKPVEWVAEVLAAKDRNLGADTAPPYGLYLVDVSYADNMNLPSTLLGPQLLAGFNE